MSPDVTITKHTRNRVVYGRKFRTLMKGSGHAKELGELIKMRKSKREWLKNIQEGIFLNTT